MKKVYVAGRLNDSAVGYIKNCHQMMVWAEAVRKAGFSIFVPCLDFLMGVIFGYYEYDDYFDNSMPWLESSDALFIVPGSEESKGTNREIARAVELGIPVYHDLQQLKRDYDKVE